MKKFVFSLIALFGFLASLTQGLTGHAIFPKLLHIQGPDVWGFCLTILFFTLFLTGSYFGFIRDQK